MNTVTIETRKIETLKEHSQNTNIYGNELSNIEELAQQIKFSGIVKPLIVTNNGVIISGHRRYKACCLLGMKQIPVEIRNFNNESEELECLLLENSYRMKTMEQKVREARIYEEIETEKAKQRMHAGNKPLISQYNADPVENLPQGDMNSDYGKTRDIVAKKLNIGSGRTYEKAKKVVEKIDELKSTGENEKAADLSATLKDSVNSAYNLLRREEKLQEVERNIQEFKQRTAPSNFVDIYRTNNKYNIIYADPPWEYFNDGNHSARLHYHTMPIDDICKLPIQNITAKDCILFMWVTYPTLQDSFKVIHDWGFKYVTAGFCWVKLNPCGTPFFGLGNWTRANSELCLLATKGNVTRIDNTIPQVLQSIRQEHSKKPDVIRDLIVRLVGDLPKIELFSRQAVTGWSYWGNEQLK